MFIVCFMQLAGFDAEKTARVSFQLKIMKLFPRTRVAKRAARAGNMRDFSGHSR